MMSLFCVVYSLFIVFCLTGLFLLYVQYHIRRVHRFPLHDLAGPPSPGWWGTHLTRLQRMSTCERDTEKWVHAYGRSFRYQGIGPYDERLFTLDPAALAHVLGKTAIYHKPWHARQVCRRLLGEGLVVAEGDVHKRQRRASRPAFSQQNLNAMVPDFFAKATELRDRFLGLEEEQPKIDVLHWVSRAAFDIIGLTGFGYDFHAIRNETNEVYLAYKRMFEKATYESGDVLTALGMYCPLLWKILPTKTNRIINASLKIIREKGRQLVEEEKRRAMGAGQGKDLLSLLVKSNMSADIPEGQKISDKDLFNQISTFLFAGSDTTSHGITWTLYLLARHPDFQSALRRELQAVDDDDAAQWPEIEKLPLLDMAFRESMRCIPPVHALLRVAMQDDVIPLSKPIRLMSGGRSTTSTIAIKRGQMVHIPIQYLNMDRDIWGPTAWEFDPYRWRDLTKQQQSMTTMTFSCGPRSCIGMRYSEMEIKIVLFVLLRSLSFSDPDDGIIKRSLIVTRPFVRGRLHEGSICPMTVRRAVV